MSNPSPSVTASATSFPSPTSPWLPLIGLCALAALLLLLRLGDLGLTDRDEGSNAEAAREMLETGEWISPTLNYHPRYAKPAFTYWVISASYALFGVNEFAARLPSALFGIGLLIVQYGFLTRIFHPALAAYGALILLLNIEFLAICRMVLTDAALVFFTTLSAYGFWLGFHHEGRSRRWIWLFYLGMALALLTKGPIGIMIPLFAVVPYLTLTRQWHRFWHTGLPLPGALAFLLVAAPWYIAMFAIHGEDYAAAAHANTLGRFANPMEGHGGTILFYIPVFLLAFFPWSAFLLPALAQAVRPWRIFRSGGPPPAGDSALLLFCAMWVITGFIFFSLSATRLPHYIFPLFPPASLLVACFWSRIMHDSAPPGVGGAVTILTVLGYLIGLGLASLPWIYTAFMEQIAREFPAAPRLKLGLLPFLTGGMVLAGTIAMRYWCLADRHRSLAFWIGAGLVISLVLLLVTVALPRFNRYFIAPPQELAEVARYNLGPRDRLIQFGRKRPSLAFYARRRVHFVNPGEDEKLRALLAQPGRSMLILQAPLHSKLPAPAADFPVVLHRYGFLLLSSEAMIP